jgi:protein-L-isoaspartate(D-aspartate) O-methyltransferase
MKHLKDSYKHKGKRKILIAKLKEMGIHDDAILQAFDAVPRHYFLDLVFEAQAYQNMAFQIGSGQTISHPYTVAFQTQLLELEKGMKVLEIGTGSGFQACILCKLGAKVFSIERHKELHKKAKSMIDYFKFSARLFFGDGYKGNKTYGPYDRILVTCGAPEVPAELLTQLKNGGIIVIPVGSGKEQKMIKLKKDSEGKISEEDFGTFKFVPMLERKVN